MTCVIMQPTYLPWAGYFDMMDTADVFVLFDTVQFEKQAWQQRNRIKSGSDKSIWLTVPVIQNLGQKIIDVKVNNAQEWTRKHWGTIEQFYRKAPYWKNYSADFAKVYDRAWTSLPELNITLIELIRGILGIDTVLVRASDRKFCGEKVGLLVNICREFGADVYLSPVRASDYIEEDNVFGPAGIKLLYHRYEHPVYSQQFEGFMPFMSVIDLIFNAGPKALEIIRSGRLDYGIEMKKSRVNIDG